MSLLGSDEELQQQLNRYVDGVMPVVNQFYDDFDRGVLVPVLVDPLDEQSLYGMQRPDIRFQYYNLSNVDTSSELEYQRFARTLYNYDGYIFDNIDNIPEGPAKEFFEELVRFALKREDDFPLADTPLTVNFSEKKIGARCKAIPDYLEDKSTYATWLVIPEPGKEEESVYYQNALKASAQKHDLSTPNENDTKN